jgi:hypothetical protein
MEKEKKNNNIGVIAILALLLIAVLAFGIWAWSKYTSTLNGNGTATVASWKFGTTTSLNLDLGTASKESIVDSHNNVKANLIAPGTQGHFNVGLNTKGTEVALNYVITLTEITNKPANLKFYSDASCTKELVAYPSSGEATGLQLTGSLSKEDAEANAEKLIPIYWKWAYEDPTGDTQLPNSADVTDAGKNVTFKLTVTGTQADPNSAEVVTNTTATE